MMSSCLWLESRWLNHYLGFQADLRPYFFPRSNDVDLIMLILPMWWKSAMKLRMYMPTFRSPLVDFALALVQPQNNTDLILPGPADPQIKVTILFLPVSLKVTARSRLVLRGVCPTNRPSRVLRCVSSVPQAYMSLLFPISQSHVCPSEDGIKYS